MLQALKNLNYKFEILIIDPFITKKLELLLKDFPNASIIKKKAEEIELEENLKPLGDVDFIYNRLLPKIKNCLIHIHDIYFPYLYQSNLKENPWYQWSETQLLYCYLTNNDQSKIVLDTSELFHNKKEILEKIFPNIKLAKFDKGLRTDKEDDRYFPASIYLQQ